MYEPRHIPASHRLSAWLLSALFALSLCVQQAWAAPAERTVIPLGQAVGIKLFADGVLVVALADGPTPARTCGLRQGDIITAMDGAAVGSTEQVQDLLADTAGAPVVLSVRRGADALALTACARENNGVWQLGAWIRDSMAGIGTLTYYDPATGQYGALGHGITDVDTAQLMPQCVSYDDAVEVTIMDLPQQLEMMRQQTKELPGAMRIHGYGANLLDPEVPFPTGFDAIWMSQFLDCFSEEEVTSILTRAARSMNRESRLYIMETFWNRQKFDTAAYCLTQISLYFTAMANGNSKMYHSDDMERCIKAAGLEVEKIDDHLGMGHSIVQCRLK